MGYTWNNQGNTFGFISGLIPQSNVWSFVALVISPTNAIIYLYNTNGQFSATNTVAATGPNQTLTVYGRIATGLYVTPDTNYSDTVTASVTF